MCAHQMLWISGAIVAVQVYKGTAVIGGTQMPVAVKLYTTKFTELTQAQIFEVSIFKIPFV